MHSTLPTRSPIEPCPVRRAGRTSLSQGRLGGVAYTRGTLDDFHTAICGWLREERAGSRMIGYVNPHVYRLAETNARLREFLLRADLVCVDGLGVSAGVLLVNREWQPRTVMTPLFDRVLATDDLPAVRAVLIGGTDEVLARGVAAMNRAARRIEIVGTRSGYQPIGDYLCFLEHNPAADLVLIAMGTPRSEELALAAAGSFAGKILWSIGGGTLHFYAGTLRRVPPIVSTLGLQWLWRMVHEPRIAPRYLIGIPAFVASMLCLLLARRPAANL